MRVKWKKAFSIVVAIWLALLISLLALYLIEYMYPFSRNVKWIENSAKSYYNANSWVEEMVYFINQNETWTETGSTIVISDPYGFGYKLVASWQLMPPIWEWDSEFDEDWNIIRQWKPIQLVVWDWKPNDFSDIRFIFRVPDLWTPTSLSWWTNFPIINWQLSWSWETLIASWSYITADEIDVTNENDDWEEVDWDDIKWGNFTAKKIDLETRLWATLLWDEKTFWNFYISNCWVGKKCTLKLSIINKIVLDNIQETPVPYLEWKLAFDWLSTEFLPLRFARVESTWKSYGFRKDLKAKLSQLTGIEAFDFAVFQ